MDGVLFELSRVRLEGAHGGRLRGVSCTVPDHGITVVAGPSGSGKSSLLRLCNRLEVPSSGRILYRGEDLEAVDPLRLRRDVGMVFQHPVALPGTVASNLREASPGIDDAAVSRVLGRVGLAGMEDRDAEELSGGEVQRMGIARTLLTDPRVVLFDEPTSSLDPGASTSIEALAVDLADEGTPSVWVTHDLAQMERLAHHLIVVIDGAVAQEGDMVDVVAEPIPEVARFLAGEERW